MDDSRRLIEAAVATGDPQAQRVAAIAYISADFGSFEPDRAASLFRRAAEAGDPQAMFHYARVLSEGIGVPANHAGAVDFLGRAAGAGLTEAQYTLGTWLLEQYRTNALSDPTEAVAWLERAAQRGFSTLALNRLQWLYGWTGREAPWNDKTRYFAWTKPCSGLADPYCQYGFSIAFSNGWGTAKDPVRAYVHALIARDLGNQNVNVKTIDDLGALLSASERADATERARTLRHKLKPAPQLVYFQYPDAVRPSPWATAEEIGDAAPQASASAPRPVETSPSGAAPAAQPAQTPPAAQTAQPAPAAQPAQTPPAGAAADWTACKGDNADLALAACGRLIAGGLPGPELGLAHYYKGFNHSRKRQFDQAVSDYDEAIRLRANLANAHNRRGLALMALGKVDAAIADFDEVIRAEPSFAFGHLNRAEAYERKNQTDKVITDASAAIRLDPKLVGAYAIRAAAHLEKSQYPDVITDCTTALSFNPKHKSCLDRRGFAHMKLGKNDLALADFDESLRVQPRSLWTLKARGEVRRDTDQVDAAIADYSEALSIQSNDYNALVNRANLYYRKDQYRLAVTDAAKAIEVDRRPAQAFFARGRALLELRDYDAAGRDLDEAIRIDPAFTLAHLHRADVHYMKSQYQLAVADAARAIELDRKLVTAYIVRGRAQMEIGRLGDASSDFLEAISIAPRDARAYYYSAIVGARIEEKQYESCPKSGSRRPSDGGKDGGGQGDRMGDNRAGDSRIIGGVLPICATGLRYDTSLRELKDAIDLNPNYADAYAFRGRIYNALRQRDQAIADLRKALQINPNHASARDTLRAMNVSP